MFLINKSENNFCFENLIQLYVFEYLLILNLDNAVYKDFAYTSDLRVFEVLIYWIDIESHSSRTEKTLMIAAASTVDLCSSFESGISIYFLLTGVRTKIR